MKTLVRRRSALFALIGLVLSPLAVAHASSSPADSVQKCALFDYEQWRREHPRPAGKALALDVGEPRTVRMIYFLPNDRPYRAEVVDSMKVMIRRVQTFYAEQMQAHGYGNSTFRFETDAQGEPRVHRVDGRHAKGHYFQYDTVDEVLDDIDPIFDLGANVYLIVVDTDTGIRSDGSWAAGVASFTKAFVPSGASFNTVAHELGHAFDLRHDFSNDKYIMSYGSGRLRLSACHAEYLAVHTYFNRNSSISAGNSARPTGQLISSPWYPPGSASVPIRLKVGSSKGLHQVILFDKTKEPHSAAGSFEVKACRGLAGEKEAVVAFAYDGKLPSSPGYSLSSSVVQNLEYTVSDAAGGRGGQAFFNLVEMSPYLVATLEGHTDGVQSVSFSPDGTMLASGTLDQSRPWESDETVILWEVASRRKIATLEGYRGGVQSVSFSPDGTMLASGTLDQTVILWEVASRRKIATLEGHTHWVRSVSFSPDGTMLASGARDGTVILWEVASRRKIATLEGYRGGVMSVSFSPDGTMLASGARDGTVILWEVASRRKIATLEGHTRWVWSVSFSPDGTMLASGGWDETVILWEVASRRKIATLEGHTDGVRSVSFSPDGATLASGSGVWDGTIRLWEVASRREIATFGTPLDVQSVSFSPDGATLVAGLGDGTITLWDVPDWEQAVPHRLTKVSGDNQEGPVSTQLAAPLMVSVLDQDDSPLAGVRVTFSVAAGGGMLSPTNHADPCAVGSSASSIASYTDANGRASARLTLGVGTNRVKVTVEGLESVTFTATAAEQAMPHRLTKVCGDDQEGAGGAPLAEPFVVSVSDEDGAAIAGVVVSFAVTTGGGTLSSATATTDANGRAATRLTLGSDPGTNMVSATVEGLALVTFTATGQEDPLVSLFDLFGSGKRAALLDRTQLLQNAPNPFNSETVLSYFLLEPGLTRLEVFALTGQRIAVLHQGPQQAGYHRLHWDGRDGAGHPVASGAYLYRLATDETALTRKLILLR